METFALQHKTVSLATLSCIALAVEHDPAINAPFKLLQRTVETFQRKNECENRKFPKMLLPLAKHLKEGPITVALVSLEVSAQH